jgi:hypothetical protein
MPDTPRALDPATEKRLAAALFNRVWELLDKPDRSPAEADAMLHAAHASRYHWGEVGAPVNLVRGEWQVSRVYSALKRPEPARHHAERCLALCREHGIGGFDLAYAHEAVARAASLSGDRTARDLSLSEAARLAAAVESSEDRALLQSDLATVP